MDGRLRWLTAYWNKRPRPPLLHAASSSKNPPPVIVSFSSPVQSILLTAQRKRHSIPRRPYVNPTTNWGSRPSESSLKWIWTKKGRKMCVRFEHRWDGWARPSSLKQTRLRAWFASISPSEPTPAQTSRCPKQSSGSERAIQGSVCRSLWQLLPTPV